MKSDLPTMIGSWQEEMQSAYLYRLIAVAENAQEKYELFMQLATAADAQATIWLTAIENAGGVTPEFRPDARLRIVAALIRWLGPRKILPILAAMKVRGLSIYTQRSRQNVHPVPQAIEEVGASHRGTGMNGGLRAAVFGVSDGLVSIACLVFGVTGSNAQASTVLLTGIAGLFAGAFSMAAGEYVSMRSQREMFEYQIGLERQELAQYPDQEAKELQLIYMARGLSEQEAQSLAKHMVANPEIGLDILAREELGLNPDELGSPWLAAMSSFAAFLAGGIIPLLPHFFAIEPVLPVSIGLTWLALFSIGALLSLFSGRSALKGGLRMWLIGTIAGVVTYGLGYFADSFMQ